MRDPFLVVIIALVVWWLLEEFMRPWGVTYGVSEMNINKTNTVAGVPASSWPNSQRGPTFDGDGSALPASQRLFIKAMRYLEENEDEIVIEALELPHTYTGKTIPILDRITTATQWHENLYALLDAIEQETGRPFADTYVTRLFSYNFLEDDSIYGYTPIITHEDHNGP